MDCTLCAGGLAQGGLHALRAPDAPEPNSAWLGFGSTAPADVDIDPARLRLVARNGHSSPLSSADALQMAARARSARLDLRRFTGQHHECLLHSTQRRTFSCMECTGTHEYTYIEDACGGSSPHPQTTPPSNLRVLRDHLYLPDARQVEVKARIITMTFAVNSSC